MKSIIYGKIGFRYIQDIDRVSPEIIKRARKYSAANLSDGLNKFYTMDYGIRPLFKSPKMIGSAVTVKVRSGDNLMLHKALELVKPGDVLVVETQGGYGYAVAGELMVSCMKGIGVAGLVVDGTVRDLEECKKIGLPIFARGTVCGAGDKMGPGEVNFPIACGGVVVMPGDLVVGDEDGVVVIPKDDVEDVFQAADKKLASEEKRHKEISEGIFVRPGLEELMLKNGFVG
ncbi:MAG: RraA family protein [Candidatus Caldatribacteriota bacterium]